MLMLEHLHVCADFAMRRHKARSPKNSCICFQSFKWWPRTRPPNRASTTSSLPTTRPGCTCSSLTAFAPSWTRYVQTPPALDSATRIADTTALGEPIGYIVDRAAPPQHHAQQRLRIGDQGRAFCLRRQGMDGAADGVMVKPEISLPTLSCLSRWCCHLSRTQRFKPAPRLACWPRPSTTTTTRRVRS